MESIHGPIESDVVETIFLSLLQTHWTAEGNPLGAVVSDIGQRRTSKLTVESV